MVNPVILTSSMNSPIILLNGAYMRKLSILVIIALLISACGSTPEPEPPPPPPPVAAPPPPPPPPPPVPKTTFTVSTRRTLQEDQLYEIQFYISTNLVLTREINTTETSINALGAIVIRNGRDAEEITVAAETPGEMVVRDTMMLNGVETEYLGICFEDNVLNTLYFIPNAEKNRYELLYYMKNGLKTILYDEHEFEVVYRPEIPYLLIINEAKVEEIVEKRNAAGRKLY
jgi:hypothetical protein